MKIFVGVITHPKSTHDPSNYIEFISDITGIAQKKRFELEVSISKENTFDFKKISGVEYLTREIQNLMLGVRFDYFSCKKNEFSFKVRILRKVVLNILRILKGFVRFALYREFRETNSKITTRLRNINAAHLELFSLASSMEADYCLILEDDAKFIGDSSKLNYLIEFLENLPIEFICNPIFVSLSKSFTFEELGISHLIPNSPEPIFNSSRPFTNTTCAMVYNSKFLECVEKIWIKERERGMDAPIPIDWIVNDFILRSWSEGFQKISSFHMKEEIFLQTSMH